MRSGDVYPRKSRIEIAGSLSPRSTTGPSKRMSWRRRNSQAAFGAEPSRVTRRWRNRHARSAASPPYRPARPGLCRRAWLRRATPERRSSTPSERVPGCKRPSGPAMSTIGNVSGLESIEIQVVHRRCVFLFISCERSIFFASGSGPRCAVFPERQRNDDH